MGERPEGRARGGCGCAQLSLAGCLLLVGLLGLYTVTNWGFMRFVIGPPAVYHPATVTARRWVRSVHVRRPLADGEPVPAGSRLLTGVRGTKRGSVTVRFASRTVTLEGSASPPSWPEVSLAPGEEISSWSSDFFVTIDCPGGPQRREWPVDARSFALLPVGEPCQLADTIKGAGVRLLDPAAATASIDSSRLGPPPPWER